MCNAFKVCSGLVRWVVVSVMLVVAVLPARAVLDNKVYAQAEKLPKTKAMITIAVEDDAVHERVVDVLNACAGADIQNVTFGTVE